MAHIPPSDSPGAPARPGPSLSAPALPDAAAIVPARIGGGGKRNRWGALSVSADGEVEELGAEAALDLLAREAALVVHPAFTARRIALGLAGRQGFRAPGPKVLDLLELFAFVHPAAPCLPTPGGLARALGRLARFTRRRRGFSPLCNRLTIPTARRRRASAFAWPKQAGPGGRAS